MTFLGIHEGSRFSQAVDINKWGTIIGNSYDYCCSGDYPCPCPLRPKAFLWDNGIFIDLNGLGGLGHSKAVDINDKGEVVLTQYDGDEPIGARYWPGSGTLFPDLCRVIVDGEDGEERTEGTDAVAINENGHIIFDSGGTVGFQDLNWTVCEVLNHLPIGPPEKRVTYAIDINDSQYVNHDDIPDPHVIGNSGVDDNSDNKLTVWEDDTVQGFFWDGGAMYPVDHLGGGTSQVSDMNNLDQVVGGATTSDKSIHAFLWGLGEDERGIIRDLGTLGGRNSFATGINEAGQVVGYSETGVFYTEQGISPVPVWHAFLWDKGVMYDLGVHNDFYDYSFVQPYPFSEAVDINAGGEVAGNSITINSHYRGFYLLPVFP